MKVLVESIDLAERPNAAIVDMSQHLCCLIRKRHAALMGIKRTMPDAAEIKFPHTDSFVLLGPGLLGQAADEYSFWIDIPGNNTNEDGFDFGPLFDPEPQHTIKLWNVWMMVSEFGVSWEYDTDYGATLRTNTIWIGHIENFSNPYFDFPAHYRSNQ